MVGSCVHAAFGEPPDVDHPKAQRVEQRHQVRHYRIRYVLAAGKPGR